MPERTPTNKPVILAGTTLMSGDANTGQQLFTQGGTRTHTIFSGTAGGDAAIFVGAGRLDAAFFHPGAQLALSGQSVMFYDAASPYSGGPIPASGQTKVVGVLATVAASRPAASGDVFQGGVVQQFGFAFTSGLCFQGRSGQFGWSASYTPVVSGG